MEREYYSIPEAAARLGLSRIAVFKRVKKGRLAALRFGRNWAVPAAALEAASASEKSPAIATAAGRVRKRAPVRRVIPPRQSPSPRKDAAPVSSPDAEMDSMGWD